MKTVFICVNERGKNPWKLDPVDLALIALELGLAWIGLAPPRIPSTVPHSYLKSSCHGEVK